LYFCQKNNSKYFHNQVVNLIPIDNFKILKFDKKTLKQDGYYIKNICHNLMSFSTMHSLGTTQSYLHAQICNDSHLFLNSNECLKLNMIKKFKNDFVKTFLKKGLRIFYQLY
jgi:hypothetical protein